MPSGWRSSAARSYPERQTQPWPGIRPSHGLDGARGRKTGHSKVREPREPLALVIPRASAKALANSGARQREPSAHLPTARWSPCIAAYCILLQSYCLRARQSGHRARHSRSRVGRAAAQQRRGGDRYLGSASASHVASSPGAPGWATGACCGPHLPKGRSHGRPQRPVAGPECRRHPTTRTSHRGHRKWAGVAHSSRSTPHESSSDSGGAPRRVSMGQRTHSGGRTFRRTQGKPGWRRHASHAVDPCCLRAIRRELDAASLAMLDSQSRPHTASVFTTRPVSLELSLRSPLFRVLLRWLRLPLPLSAARCRCRQLPLRDHIATCLRSGILHSVFVFFFFAPPCRSFFRRPR